MMRSLFFVIGVCLLGLLVRCNYEEDAVAQPPEAFLKVPTNGFEVDINDTLFLEPQITYNYKTSYQWYLNGAPISGEKNRVLMVTPNGQFGTFHYTFKVWNDVGEDTLSVDVNALVKVDFEEIDLGKKLYSIGAVGSSVRTSKLLELPVVNDSVNNYWNGFAISKQYRTSLSDSSLYQFAVYSSNGGDEASKNFLVYYEDIVYGNKNFLTFSDGQKHRIGKLAVNNSAYAYTVMKIGDKYPLTEPFMAPYDWFVVRFTGFDDMDSETGIVDVFLADFHSSSRNYIIANWTNIDLSSLGLVKKVQISFLSSDVGENGINTPVYVCIDNVRIVE